MRMKKIILLIFTALLTLPAGAQKMSFRQFREKYSGQRGYTTVEVTQAMLNLIGFGKESGEGETLFDGIKGITRICIITADSRNDDFVGDMKSVVKEGSEYQLLTSVAEDGQNVMFYYKEVKGTNKSNDPPRISEFLMILYGAGDNLIMNIHGDFTVKQITSIADKAVSGKSINISF